MPAQRIWAVRTALLVALFVVISLLLAVSGGRGSAAEGIAFGVTPEPIDGFRQDGVAEIESQLGRHLDLVRVFETWESTFPSSFHTEMIEGERLMVVSVRPRRDNGALIEWRDLANAAPGSTLYNEMVEWGRSLAAADVPVWFALHHEPEAAGSAAYGDADDFKAAWQRFVDIIRAEGADQVEFAWIMTAWAFEVSASDDRYAANWYPGDAYVDLIGSDAYNWGQCRQSPTDYWRSLEDTIEAQRQFGLAHPDKDLFLAEVASTERPSEWGDAKADWITEAKSLFKQPGWEQFVAISWFDVIDDSYPYCHWPADSSEDSLAALRDLGADPFYGGGTEPPTTPPPTTPPPSTVPPVPGPFADVASGHLFADEITWLAEAGITIGCNPPENDRFCPDGVVTRGQMAAFLVRALGLVDDGGGDVFVDDDGLVFEGDIDRLATAGVTFGCNPPENDRFCPDGVVTRGQMAAFLVRALGLVDDGGGDVFVDDDGLVFEGDIDRLATAGVTAGCNPPTNDRYCPSSAVTRAEMAAFLFRAMG